MLLMILFTYSFVSFGAEHIEQLKDVRLGGKPVALVIYPQPHTGSESNGAKILFIAKPLQLKIDYKVPMHDRVQSPIIEGLFKDDSDDNLEYPKIQELLTQLIANPHTSLQVGQDKTAERYQLNHLSIIAASEAHNQAIAEQDHELGYQPVNISAEQHALLKKFNESPEVNKLRKNKDSKFPLAVIAIPVVLGGATFLLVGGPAIMITNLAALWASLLAVGISITAGMFAIGTTIVISIGGMLLPVTIPFLILRDIVTGLKK